MLHVVIVEMPFKTNRQPPTMSRSQAKTYVILLATSIMHGLKGGGGVVKGAAGLVILGWYICYIHRKPSFGERNCKQVHNVIRCF